MNVIYCRRSNLGSWLLRLFLRSSWSHCGVVTPAGTVIEAAAFHGVIERPAAVFLSTYSSFAFKEIPLQDDAAAIAFARTQLGKRYDWLGALGIVFAERKWNDPANWFCSELIEAACAAGGRQRFVQDAWRVTPQTSWMVA